MKVLLTGGGTGGHIFPALSLWRHLKARVGDAAVLYVGTEQGLESRLVPEAGVPFVSVHAAGLRRELSLNAVRTLATTYRGYREALRVVRDFRPDVAVGTGGFVALPVIYAATKLGVPSVIWEGNARPGLTNQLLMRRVDAVAVCFPESEASFARAKRVVFTGNPRGSEVVEVSAADKRRALDNYRILRGQRVILIVFGSRGSETANRVVAEMLSRFADRPDWRVLFVTGERHFEDIQNQVGPLPRNVTLHPFIADMPALLPHVDLMVSRAGSSTLAEICALGVASILVPSPYVTANHQEENAMQLARAGAARVLREADLTPDVLWKEICDMLEGDLADIQARARSFGRPDAVRRFGDLVLEVAGRRRT
ncbi:undecaprenyldiphospho-muramoylpentapeptide beta-N-acetylglucosaminyltransferase [Alicyclobacillus mali]|uniref:UDP-N-acetylglucosamine--N-acetylmuramyl-(pentapeptide) pyrophosphoryl-undecaprenol N-acetylglucosamine transferase n=1 Tax=Alicyclobacillus mali (ex Roth et al. 2021) TaxID=1123961 RepID=A0ABS0F2U3_9BACL|nr:undecaprenyldiphospho-muramoylpentapeptide beta-N-acetylglucosaminyltransferase [Alicyclobacillus mali (ex Roth et al. 2021)]MBF8377566.1 undecaprenyldiphospho-muramoylpentapeptide beta-N-acetylglucosaminyltransferase [Alicyclobacillus mali (ex Roth et al. 2021)]MCL6489096.1 undecaprenyldiphospho-muramoylpentapeptide beta-N-acetylglucosaminyltransferase [Alicyclobacillus mali (ex Roth et al. 2021)]